MADFANDTKHFNPSGSSTARTVLNIVMTSVGVSIYTLPKCFSSSGALMSVILLILSTLVTGFCMILLGRTAMYQTDLKSYPDIGKAAFGVSGMIAVQLCMYAGLVLICGGMLMLMGDSLNGLINGSDSPVSVTFKALCAVGLLPLVMLPSFKEIGLVSIAGIVGISVAVFAAVIASFSQLSDTQSTDSITKPDFVVHSNTFMMIMNGFCVSPAIPALAAGIKNQTHFPRAVVIALLTIAVMFAVVGFCYLGFDSVSDSIMATITSHPSLNVYAKVMQVGTLIMCVSHFLCLFAPIGQGIDGLLMDKLVVKVFKTDTPFMTLATRIFGRTVGVACCFGLAAKVKNFGQLIGIVATTVVPFLQVFFPVAFYLAIAGKNGTKMSRRSVYGMAVALIAGLAYSIIGFYLLILSFQ